MGDTVQEATKAEIAKSVRLLREKRGLTQTELSKKLGMSQGRYSVIERGDGSFSAEQFVEILKVFNVTVGDLLSSKADPEAFLHNALARLGASHLVEDSRVLPSEVLEEAEHVIREVLIAGAPARQVTALAPILIRQAERLNLGKLWNECMGYGLGRRFAWLMDSTRDAIQTEVANSKGSRFGPRPLLKAKGILEVFLSTAGPQVLLRSLRGSPGQGAGAPLDLDVIGPKILTEKTLLEVVSTSSSLAKKWGIATAIQPEDFQEAVRAAFANTH